MTQVMVPTVDVLTGLAMGIVIVVGGNAVLGGRLDVGVMVAFIFYVQRFFDPVRMLSMQYTIMQRAMAAGHRIFEVLDVPVTIVDKADAEPLADFEPTVEFRNVTFGYDPARPVLHDVSFEVQPRQVVALVGPTGSGKTSIIALAHRFYEVDQGQVLIGGRDVRDVTLESLGRNIGMVLQEPFLFSGTIEENIRYNTEGATREDVISAAKSVSAHDFIMRLPEGYDTQLGQRGRNISLGQRQLLSFARALVADPQILILDEATANIDSFTEQAIHRHRPPTGHHPRRRQDHRPATGPHPGAGPPRCADGQSGALFPALHLGPRLLRRRPGGGHRRCGVRDKNLRTGQVNGVASPCG